MKYCFDDGRKKLSKRGVVAVAILAVAAVVVVAAYALTRPWDLYAAEADAVDYTIPVDSTSMVFSSTLRAPEPEGDCSAELSGSVLVGKPSFGLRAVRVDLDYSLSRGADASEGSFYTSVHAQGCEWVRGIKATLDDDDGQEMPGLTAKINSYGWTVRCSGDGSPATGTVSALFLIRDWDDESSAPYLQINAAWDWTDADDQAKSHSKVMLISVEPADGSTSGTS